MPIKLINTIFDQILKIASTYLTLADLNFIIKNQWIRSDLNLLHANSNPESQCMNEIKHETLRVVTIAMICSTLASVRKFQYFGWPIYDPVERL